MPHIRVTMSRNVSTEVDLGALLADLTALLSGFETIEPSAIKSYADVRDLWAMGDGAPEGFVHTEICLLDGRSEALQGQIADAFLGLLRDSYQTAFTAGRVGITVEFREMTSATYRKDRVAR